MAKLLLVDDDEQFIGRLKEWLALEGHVVDMAHSGGDALQLLGHLSYDVIILDWNMPDMNGIDVCRRYRSLGGTSYIIFLTGKGDIADKEQGFDAGSDDYLVKPVNVRELSARIRRMLRRQTVLLPDELNIEDLSLDPKSRTASVEDKQAHLMPKEVALLEFLMRHPNEQFSAQALLDSVWPADSEASCESVRTWMMRLRNKLGTIGKRDFIKTAPGSGYYVERAK